MRPDLPKSMMMESERTNGGETTGSMETTWNRPLMNLVLSLTYTSTYAKSRPTKALTMLTSKPTARVLVMAVVNEPIWKMRVKTSRLGPESVTKESTSRIASGYRMNSVRKAMSTTMVVTMMGSPINFLRSRAAPWSFAIRLLLSLADGRTNPRSTEPGGPSRRPPGT